MPHDNQDRLLGDSADLKGVLTAHVANPETTWSLGTFGAVAEFSRSSHEVAVTEGNAADISVVTDRGGIRIRPIAGLRLVASESATGDSWNQRVALCLKEEHCAMNRRGVLTELGPDSEAMREIRSETASCSISASIPCRWMPVCACPTPMSSSGCGGVAAVGCSTPRVRPWERYSTASPHRVFMSRVGRVEVFQPIPPANGKSPEGPHTHVLPKLLRHRRTHSATEAIPEGWVPCAHFYPAHPMKDAFGAGPSYEGRYHTAFQDLLFRFGDDQLVDLKNRMLAAVSEGHDPSAFPVRGRSVCARHHSDRLTPTAGRRRSVAGAGGMAGGSRPRASRRRQSYRT